MRDSVQGSGFAALVEQKCDDLIGHLLMSDSFARECVKAFIKSQNVVEICKHAMSQDMVITLSSFSENYYIIPRNGIDEDEVKMYKCMGSLFIIISVRERVCTH